jgi:general secretion pathway protein G
MKTNRSNKGFTLVEILIVVVILGILAAIVIPQFSEASSEARNSSVQSNLQMVRSQVELYKIQHNDFLPGGQGTSTLFEALTEKTDIYGSMAGTDDYGPYMQAFPTNALNGKGGVVGEIVFTATADALPTAVSTHGWEWNSVDGRFYACDNIDIEKDGSALNDSITW